MTLPISVIIITFNEEKNIEECVKSVYGSMDEIFIVDSYSTDKTLEIARNYTGNIFQHPFNNYAQQRNWSQGNLPVRNEWVFHLDADERVSQELIAQLGMIFRSCVDADGFMLARRTIFRDRWIRHGGHYPAYHMRIFRKNLGLCENRLYDQHFIVSGKTLKIEGDIVNVIMADLKLWASRHRQWAYLEAREMLFNNRNTMDIKLSGSPIERKRWLRYNVYYRLPLFVRAFTYFFYRYILRLGFLDGWQGLIFHFWQGFWYRLLVDLNIFKLALNKNKGKR